jgi:hypothetical protein
MPVYSVKVIWDPYNDKLRAVRVPTAVVMNEATAKKLREILESAKTRGVVFSYSVKPQEPANFADAIDIISKAIIRNTED